MRKITIKQMKRRTKVLRIAISLIRGTKYALRLLFKPTYLHVVLLVLVIVFSSYQAREANAEVAEVTKLLNESAGVNQYLKKILSEQERETEVLRESQQSCIDTLFKCSEYLPEEDVPKVFEQMDYEDKVNFIKTGLLEQGLSAEEAEKMLTIAHYESCRDKSGTGCFKPDKVPPTMVYHCKTDTGYKAVEIKNVNGRNVQAHCSDYGWTQTGSEQSIGIFQILVSTWRGYGCEGEPRSYDASEQVACAAKIYKKSGYGAWSTHIYL